VIIILPVGFCTKPFLPGFLAFRIEYCGGLN